MENKKVGYMLFNQNNNPCFESFSHYRKNTTNFFMKEFAYSWNDIKQWGWTCKKVEIIVKEIN